MTTRRTQERTPEWRLGLAKAQAKDWKITLWASDAYRIQGLVYQDGYNDAKAEDAGLLEALQAWVEASGWDELPDPDDFVLTPEQRHVWQLTRKAIAQAKGKET